MLKNISSQKEKTQAAMHSLMDAYYEEFSKRSNEPNFTIDVIEKLMVEQQYKLRNMLIAANSELTSSVTVECKKNALSAEAN